MGQLGDLSPAASVTIGVIVGLLSTSIQSLGLTLQRKSHLLEDEKENELVRRPPYKRRRWQIGMFMFVVANLVGSTIQITTLPLPVLSTLQASGLVFNTICATLILGEPFTRWSIAGTVLVAGGAVLIALFGALPEPSHNLAQLLELLGRKQFILWMFGTVAIMVAIGISGWLPAHIKIDNRARVRLWRGMCFGSISAILSAHCLLLAKSAVELLVRTIVDGVNQFNRWQSWIILVALVFFALSQLYFLHRGLKLCSTSVLYPFVFCIYNIIAILDGLIYFRQTDRLLPLHAGLIGVGTFILLSGVLALSWRLPEDTDAAVPDPHSLLSPGMGLVEDVATEDEEDDSLSEAASSTIDEDTHAVSHERTPLLARTRRSSLSPALVRNTSSIKLGKQRKQGEAETSEIWDELQDSPSQVQFRLPLGRRPRRAVTLATDGRSGRLNDEEALNGSTTKSGARRAATLNFGSRGRSDSRPRPPGLRSTSTPLPSLSLAIPDPADSTAISPLWWLGLGWWNQRNRGEPLSSRTEDPDRRSSSDGNEET